MQITKPVQFASLGRMRRQYTVVVTLVCCCSSCFLMDRGDDLTNDRMCYVLLGYLNSLNSSLWQNVFISQFFTNIRYAGYNTYLHITDTFSWVGYLCVYILLRFYICLTYLYVYVYIFMVRYTLNIDHVGINNFA